MDRYNKAKEATNFQLKAFQAAIDKVRQKSIELEVRHKSLLQRQKDLADRNGGSKSSPSDKIHLNVGGAELYVLRETLTMIQGSRLEALFCGRWENQLVRDEQNRVFLDVDPYYFKKIMEYLYSLKIDQDTSWPKFTDPHEQEMFDLYVDFFHLKKNPLSSVKREGIFNFTFGSHSPKVKNKNEQPTFYFYEGLIETFNKEKEELTQFELKLDDMEQKLKEEQDFVSYFTTGSGSGSGGADHTNSLSVGDNASSGNEDCNSFTSITESDLESNLVSSPSSEQSTNQHDDYKDENSQVLNLWVDGEMISVSFATMSICKGSHLDKNFNSKEWMKKHSFKNEDGMKVVLVEHSSVFKSIVNQLRLRRMKVATSEMPYLKSDNMVLLEKVVECLFPGQREFVLPNMHPFLKLSSNIISTSSEDKQLTKWLKEVDEKCIPQELLYCASRDGFLTSTFHQLCDNKGPTVVIVETVDGSKFGGYTDQSWDSSSGQYKASNVSFLFSLKSKSDLPPTKMKIRYGMSQCTIFLDRCGGPSFGSNRYDLRINYNGDRKVYSNVGYTYELPSGATANFLCGHGKFNGVEIKDFEVFKVF